MNPGRNAPCPCGSGKKYKKCCGKLESSSPLQSGQQRPSATALSRPAKGSAPTQDEFSQLLALYNAGRYAELESRAHLLVGRHPDFGLGWKLLSASLLMQGKDALLALQKATKLLPGEAELHNNLGHMLTKHGRGSEAEASFRRALQIKPDYVDAHFNLGRNLSEQERLTEAEVSYRRALQIQPDYVDALFNLVPIKSVKTGDGILEAMILAEEAARSGATLLTDEQKTLMHFALGKCYDDIGEHEKAFPHFLEGCKLKRATIDYDPEQSARHSAAIMRNFETATLDRLRGGGDPSQVPIFVLGMPRSGTTLTEQVIASHPEVHGAGELPDLMAIALRDIAGAAFPDNARLLDQARLSAWGAEYVAGLQRRALDMPRITDKMPANFQAVGLIHLMLPNAKIIHVKRNPVDTCISCFSKLFTFGQEFSYDLAELGRYYVDYARLMEHWRKVLPEGAFLEVQYEDIVADQEAQSRRIIEYCGLEWNDACLDFHQNKRSVKTASMVQVRQPIYKSSVERWRSYEKFLGPLFDALGDLAPER
ncbi:MAG: sulfotransferase [Nitrosomonadales bacterium]|nr:sulfotransferase [Nitrosomonadales bacterium]